MVHAYPKSLKRMRSFFGSTETDDQRNALIEMAAIQIVQTGYTQDARPANDLELAWAGRHVKVTPDGKYQWTEAHLYPW